MNSIQERLPQTLGALYRSYGYMSYTMSKFEAYELYLRNKDFLLSDRVLTFTDTDGKLMALKPDVTLSIIKNTRRTDTAIEKLFYRENVYRPGKSDQGFREIMQIGLECMGEVDNYCVLEVLLLAARSLEAIRSNWVLDISHMGLLAEALDASGLQGPARKQALEAVGSKNIHELRALCLAQNVSADTLVTLADLYGSPSKTLPVLEGLFPGNPELSALKDILQALESAGYAESIKLDFSVVNDMQYYNGIVFRGFVEGVPEGVLSGGQYDGLMERMHRREKAIGFALYPDLLERLEPPAAVEQPDGLLLYPAGAALSDVCAAVSELTAKGLRINAQPDTGVRNGNTKLFVLEGNEVKCIENHA